MIKQELPRLHMYTLPFRVFVINVYKIGLLFTQTLAGDQRLGLLTAFPNEHPNLDHQSIFSSSQIRLYLMIRIMVDKLNRHYLTIGSIFHILSSP